MALLGRKNISIKKEKKKKGKLARKLSEEKTKKDHFSRLLNRLT